ncbi:unnamed protein product, partial [Iphiclides podalirius]
MHKTSDTKLTRSSDDVGRPKFSSELEQAEMMMMMVMHKTRRDWMTSCAGITVGPRKYSLLHEWAVVEIKPTPSGARDRVIVNYGNWVVMLSQEFFVRWSLESTG